MNQILATEKLYVTPELKRKRKIFKVEFILSIFLVVVLSSYGIYGEYEKNKSEETSKEILTNMTFDGEKITRTRIKTDPIVIGLNDGKKQVISVSQTEKAEEEVVVPERQIFTADNGKQYYTIGVVSIPKIKVDYPILWKESEELLKVSVCKLYGPKPNEVR